MLASLLTGCGSAGSAEQTTTGLTGTPGSGGGGPGTGGGEPGSGGSGSVTGGGTVGNCAPVPACDAAPPNPGPMLGFKNGKPDGTPNHRGRDLFLNPGDPQWVLGKFAYGQVFADFYADNDLEEEQVDIWLLRDCGTKWELLGSVFTSNDNAAGNGPNETVEGVEDDGGRVYFKIPPQKALGLGRHRVHFVVRGDLTTTESYIEVVPPGTPIFVSDVDGTLTDSEYAEFTALWNDELPGVHVDAAAAFHILAAKGYRPFYLTARPDALDTRTREMLTKEGFPPGLMHTSLNNFGATGDAAAEFKTGELAVLKNRGLVPADAFGNTESDAQAYENTGIEKATRFFYQFDPLPLPGRRIEEYTELLKEFEALPNAVCP